MEMLNLSPFPNLRFYNTDSQGREFGVLLVKGTYDIAADGSLAIADEQEPLVLTDTYHGALNSSSLRLPSDVVPKKPRSDIILNAVARSPDGAARPSWTCGIRVEGKHVLETRLRVTGPRMWEPVWGVSERARATMSVAEKRRVFGGWRLGEPEPVREVPIRYEYAYGGLLTRPGADGKEPFLEADEHNPIGCGWIAPDLTPIDAAMPAPQIEAADEPILEPHRRYSPAGLGPIPPAWLPRRPLGGTYDAHWQAHVWPNWPADYDFAYHNSAHPDLIYPGLLIGNETVRLSGLGGEDGQRVIRLPGHAIVLEVTRAGGSAHVALIELDTLYLNVADPDPRRHRAHLSWRTIFDHREVEALTFLLADFAELMAQPSDKTEERS
ncbi:DUF2169 domain-containing protein [Methylobacterium sp. Leaf100]|uniref:DUF2169 family type VI secretion system accessory protein n=1 Tax=Methylobacterium sp. Leaf100 TaxID=1736252 RepID=UPI0006FDF77A|nr:DUF2169 domain-containing protein [Methylobacterium sp. Leaf100]KQP24991.1 hypothetical protein ASF25_21375 [Methylobacterium sp. Leaf100]